MIDDEKAVNLLMAGIETGNERKSERVEYDLATIEDLLEWAEDKVDEEGPAPIAAEYDMEGVMTDIEVFGPSPAHTTSMGGGPASMYGTTASGEMEVTIRLTGAVTRRKAEKAFRSGKAKVFVKIQDR